MLQVHEYWVLYINSGSIPDRNFHSEAESLITTTVGCAPTDGVEIFPAATCRSWKLCHIARGFPQIAHGSLSHYRSNFIKQAYDVGLGLWAGMKASAQTLHRDDVKRCSRENCLLFLVLLKWLGAREIIRTRSLAHVSKCTTAAGTSRNHVSVADTSLISGCS